MFSIQLEDGRSVRRHADQLRSRTCTSHSIVLDSEQVLKYDAVSTGNTPDETESDPVTSEPSMSASDSSSSSDPSPSQEETELCGMETQTSESTPNLLCSTHVRHPPDWYGGKL